MQKKWFRNFSIWINVCLKLTLAVNWVVSSLSARSGCRRDTDAYWSINRIPWCDWFNSDKQTRHNRSCTYKQQTIKTTLYDKNENLHSMGKPCWYVHNLIIGDCSYFCSKRDSRCSPAISPSSLSTVMNKYEAFW